MEHQDWKPVVFKKKIVKREAVTKSSRVSDEQHRQRKIDMEDENFRIEKVGLSVRSAIMKARNANGMKQKDLANRLAVKPDVVISYENGKAVPNQKILQRMERILGMRLTRKKIGEWFPGKEPKQ